jgi:hypothetical protein
VTEPVKRTGGCACGAVRYEARGDPVRISVCHCKDCQLRSGSAFGIGCYFPREAVALAGGATRTYERVSDAGRKVRIHFCENCGTSVYWYPEVLPGAMGLAGGTFDDTGWLDPKLHIWSRSAQKWFRFPSDAEVLQESNIGQR